MPAEERFDFDEELLPEDSSEATLELEDDVFEVEKIVKGGLLDMDARDASSR
ncbi:hypothetical protein PF007_g32892 [Phytophthora fragariae]|nr:hypothetical protein PF007_g32892 [Phytophthora fragariae]KAE9196499.1 hypothetical protein PF004_g20119 [Phytophthora fragariae]